MRQASALCAAAPQAQVGIPVCVPRATFEHGHHRQVSRGPYPGREDDGDDEDYTELLRAAYERIEPDLRSRKALLVDKRVGSKVHG